MSFYKFNNSNAFKIFTDWDLKSYKTIEVKENIFSDNILLKIRNSIKQNIDLSLFLLILDSNKALSFQRKLNFFENLNTLYNEIIANPENKNKSIFFLCLSSDTNPFYFKESDPIKPIINQNFERSGELQKKSKNGVFKSKRFELSKKHLVFYNSKVKNPNISLIPLEDNTVAERLNSEKYGFTITYYDKISNSDKKFELKAKSTNDMGGWILAINYQANIVSENKNILTFNKEISALEFAKTEKNREIISKIFKNPFYFFENQQIRDFFYIYLQTFHSEETGLIFLLDIYLNYKSFYQKNKYEDAIIFANLLYDSLKELFNKGITCSIELSIEKSLDLNNLSKSIDQSQVLDSMDLNFPQETLSFLELENKWEIFNEKYYTLQENYIKNGKINKDFMDFLDIYLKNKLYDYFKNKHYQEFLGSDLFLKEFVFKSLIKKNFFAFEKPNFFKFKGKFGKNTENSVKNHKRAITSISIKNILMSQNLSIKRSVGFIKKSVDFKMEKSEEDLKIQSAMIEISKMPSLRLLTTSISNRKISNF